MFSCKFFLSTVKKLELGTSENPDNKPLLNKAISMVSYVLLYNIITSQQPRLKHLEVYGIPMAVERILDNVKKLFSDCENRSTFFPSISFQLMLPSQAPPPYLLKSFSVAPADIGYLIRHNAIAASTRDIILFQLHNLEHVSISGLGFLSERHNFYMKRDIDDPEYNALLSTLAVLLKQPQLQSLSVDRSPLLQAYQMIEIFLCTGTTHQQSLRVVGIDLQEEKQRAWFDDETDEDDEVEAEVPSSSKKLKRSSSNTLLLHPLPAQPLPDSNGTLKSLDIGRSSASLHDWLVSIPNLQLKELKTSRRKLVKGVTFPVKPSD